MGHYEMKRDAQNQWRWIYRSSNGSTIAVSSEAYHNESDCLHSINLVKASASAPVYKV